VTVWPPARSLALTTFTLGKGDAAVEVDDEVDVPVALEDPVGPTVTVEVTVSVAGGGGPGSGEVGLKSDWATEAIPAIASTSPAASESLRKRLRES